MVQLNPVDRNRLAAAIPDRQSVLDFELLFLAVLELQTMVAASDPYTAAAGDIVYSAGTTRAQALLADGALYLRADYPALFAAIGTTYGTTLSTNFRVPDITGRVVAGKEAAGGVRLTAALGGVDGGTLGAAGGDQRLHAHTHSQATFQRAVPDNMSGTQCAGNSTNFTAQTTAATTTAGAGAAQNVQPTIVLNAFILY